MPQAADKFMKSAKVRPVAEEQALPSTQSAVVVEEFEDNEEHEDAQPIVEASKANNPTVPVRTGNPKPSLARFKKAAKSVQVGVALAKKKAFLLHEVGSPDPHSNSYEHGSLHLKSVNFDYQSLADDVLDMRDTVEFSRVEHICYENDHEVTVHMHRLGLCKHPLKLRYWTENINLSDDTYRLVDETITLAAGEDKRQIQVPLNDNPYWNVEALMNLRLQILDGEEHCKLGDLYQTRIIILNDDTFPMNADPDDEIAMLKGFLVHNFIEVSTEAKWGLFYNLYPGIFYVVNLVILKYTINTLSECIWVDVDDDEFGNYHCQLATEGKLYVFGFLFSFNFFLHYMASRRFMELKLGSKATRALRKSMFAVMVQFTPDTEEEFDTGRIMKIMEKQTERAVLLTWLKSFEIFQQVFQLGVSCLYVIYIGIDAASRDQNPMMLWLILIPVIMVSADLTIFWTCQKQIVANNFTAMQMDDVWASFVAERAAIRPLITNYGMGFDESEKFEALHKAFNDSNFSSGKFTHFAMWRVNTVSNITSTTMLVVGGFAVLRGYMSTGSFITLLSTTSNFGVVTANIFRGIFDMQKGSAAVQKIAELFNAETRRKERHHNDVIRDELVRDYQHLHPENVVPPKSGIVLERIVYNHRAPLSEANADPGSMPVEWTIPEVSAVIEGGSIIALTGAGAAGKTTFLRILGRQLFPTKGFLAYPGRWQVRFLDNTSSQMFFRGTLIANLRFGNMIEHEETEIIQLCRLMGVSQKILGRSGMQTQIMLNGSNLSTTDKVLLTVVRALLSSVDLLLLSNLLDILGEEKALNVLNVLKTFVNHRRIDCLTKENVNRGRFRKRKTVVVSTKLAPLEEACSMKLHLGEVEVDETAGRKENTDI